jgi:hypothetical protein
MGREREKEGKETGGEGEENREEDGNKRLGRGEVGGARSEERKGRGGGEGKIWTPTFWIKVTSLLWKITTLQLGNKWVADPIKLD